MKAKGKRWRRRMAEEASKWKAAALAAIDQLYANSVHYHIGGGEDGHGLKNVKQWFSGVYSAFPDAQSACIHGSSNHSRRLVLMHLPRSHDKMSILLGY